LAADNILTIIFWSLARRIYDATLKRLGISTAVIKGHSSEATTKAYLDKFEQIEIDSCQLLENIDSRLLCEY
jgi:hypothetical protein